MWAVSQEGPTVRFWPEALGTVVHLLSGEDKDRGRGRRLKPRAHAEHAGYTAPTSHPSGNEGRGLATQSLGEWTS